ncbi:MAG: hypothetical protein QHI48_04885 [Bacteroidota bacterium]|nr:hypothetical protein [Bacteroidota bacterium]
MKGRMRFVVGGANRISLAAAVAFLLSLPAAGQGTPGASDETALADLLRRAARESALRTEGIPVHLRITPETVHPMVWQVFSEELTQRGATVYTGRQGAARMRLTVDVRELRISAVPHRDSSYLRTSVAVLGVFGTDETDGAVRWSKEYRYAETDTVAGVLVCREKDFRTTDAPDLWDAVFGPIIAVAAAVVIVVLLFTVRGS